MVDKSFLNWPFFEDQHRVLAESLEDWAGKNLTQIDHQNASLIFCFLENLVFKIWF